MNRREQSEQTWQNIWLLFGAMVLLIMAILVLCLTRPAGPEPQGGIIPAHGR